MVHTNFLGKRVSLVRLHLGVVQTLHALLRRQGFRDVTNRGPVHHAYSCPERALRGRLSRRLGA